MRTVFARLIALGAISLVVGCSGNSTNPLPVVSEINNGGSPGTVTGNTTVTPGQSTTPSSSTDSKTNVPPAGAVTQTGFIFATGLTGWQYTVNFPSANAFTITPGATGAISATITQSLTAPAGVTALAYGTVAGQTGCIPIPAAGATQPNLVQYGQLTFSSGTITGKVSPVLIISGATIPAGHSNLLIATYNPTTAAWTVPLATCTTTAGNVTCAATAFTYTSATAFSWAIYAV